MGKKGIQKKALQREITFGTVADMWFSENEFRVKSSTNSKYYYMYKTHIEPTFGSTLLRDISTQTINSFLMDKLKRGVSDSKGLTPSYVRTLSIIFGSILRFANSRNLCSVNTSELFKPQVKKQEAKAISSSAVKAICTAASREPDNLYLLGTFIALNTGMRVGEICALNYKDIDFVNNVIHIRHSVIRVGNVFSIGKPKTDSSERDIPISSVLLPFLKNAANKSSSEFVVSNSDTFINTRVFEYRFKKEMDKLSLCNLNFHSLRHTFATLCVQAGVDIKTLSEILGHASVITTLNTYVHTTMDTKRQQLEKLYTYVA